MYRSFGVTIFPVLFWVCLTFNGAVAQTEPVIAIGSGGGVAASVTRYELQRSGVVVLKKGMGAKLETVGNGKIKKCAAKKVFRKLDKMKFTEHLTNEPGNTYKFIELTRDGQRYYCAWGKPGGEINADLASFYDEVLKKVQNCISTEASTNPSK